MTEIDIVDNFENNRSRNLALTSVQYGNHKSEVESDDPEGVVRKLKMARDNQAGHEKGIPKSVKIYAFHYLRLLRSLTQEMVHYSNDPSESQSKFICRSPLNILKSLLKLQRHHFLAIQKGIVPNHIRPLSQGPNESYKRVQVPRK
jgi:hypothetical protein